MSFVHFNRLPRELRDQIWAEAFAIQRQQVRDTPLLVSGQPLTAAYYFHHRIIDQPCTTPHAERQRQALESYRKFPDSTEEERQRQHLRLYVYGSRQTHELRLGENELQTLVNRFPTALVCSEARTHVIEFCRRQVEFVALVRIIEEQPPEEQSPDGKPVLEQPVFTDMATVMVTTSRSHPKDGPEAGFDSPEQVVDIVARVFGNGVKKIIWSAWCQRGYAMSEIYWPHTPLLGQSSRRREFDRIDESGHSETTHFLSPDLVLHIQREVYKVEILQEVYYDYWLMLRHTLKLAELGRAAAKPLPQLQHIEVEVRTKIWGDIVVAHLETTYKNDVLWVGKHNLLAEIEPWSPEASLVTIRDTFRESVCLYTAF